MTNKKLTRKQLATKSSNLDDPYNHLTTDLLAWAWKNAPLKVLQGIYEDQVEELENPDTPSKREIRLALHMLVNPDSYNEIDKKIAVKTLGWE